MAKSQPPIMEINPPLLNSANPWATTLDDLRSLYACASTGAVTTRTSLIKGFPHDSNKHKYLFFDSSDHAIAWDRASLRGPENASLNSLGYSPIALANYLGFIEAIAKEQPAASPITKYFIVSVTGAPEEVAESYRLIASAQRNITIPLAMEVNLSCPNIPGAPPPAYSGTSLARYLSVLDGLISSSGDDLPRLPFGLKTPPFTHDGQFRTLIDVLLASSERNSGLTPVSFITATNTLGSCLVLLEGNDNSGPVPSAQQPALPGAGFGGMAGAPLHPLALGNVATIRRLLDEHKEKLGHVRIIGVGGVLDTGGYSRMRSAGASAVGVGTGLGLKGIGIFKEIESGLSTVDGK
ncbi:hypothetical protein VTK73DRAFT_6699 [Phialemonium thermophilum]|uniref:Dihydroorotate dehydrogenase (fumarate) n=1 Tax=Phialemonium thermophilum TaxID=223376 RepID=A0ABR3XV53_9PEZI